MNNYDLLVLPVNGGEQEPFHDLLSFPYDITSYFEERKGDTIKDEEGNCFWLIDFNAS